MTKEVDIQQIIDMNYRVLTLLSIATSIIMDYNRDLLSDDDETKKCMWFLDAIKQVLYENKPLPHMS